VSKRLRSTATRRDVVVAGAGLVGTTLSMYLADQGIDVDVYERGPDPRLGAPDGRRSSVNLTLTERGLRCLDVVGVGAAIRANSVPVERRAIHAGNGNLLHQPYGNRGEALHSIKRSMLIGLLLDAAEARPGIRLHFEHRCVDLLPTTGTLLVEDVRSQTIRAERGRVVAADGVGSAIRRALCTRAGLAVWIRRMDLAYRELAIAAAEPGGPEWVADRDSLHIWPRETHMLVGFPNVDGTFTLSLFMPLRGAGSFASLLTPADVRDLFRTSFADVALPEAVDDYFARPPTPITTVRCAPWRFRDRALLIGDAAHAIVPYLGQGANAGFEDCRVLADLLDEHGSDWATTFDRFEAARRPNLDAIATLADEHLDEIGSLVGTPDFQLRKRIERALNRRDPDRYQSLYNLIAFTSIPYAEAIQLGRDQQALAAELAATLPETRIDDRELDRLVSEVLGAGARA
jgi:kynurenine 3-monooxygenase